MKFFKRSKDYLIVFKNNVSSVGIEIRSVQYDFWHLIFKKNKNKREQELYVYARSESFRWSILLFFAANPFIPTLLYFILVPKKLWPNGLSKVFKKKSKHSTEKVD